MSTQASDWQVPAATLRWLDAVPAERGVAMLVRHSVRDPLPPGDLGYANALNAEGVFALVEQASAFGSAGLLVTVLFALFTPWGSPRTASITLVGGIVVYVLGSVTGIPTPFLASLGASLLRWGIGCAMDSAAS